MAHALDVPFYEVSHQQGHLAAAGRLYRLFGCFDNRTGYNINRISCDSRRISAFLMQLFNFILRTGQ